MAQWSEPTAPIKCALFIARTREDDGSIDYTYMLALRKNATDGLINRTTPIVLHIDRLGDWARDDFFTVGFLFPKFTESDFCEDQWDDVSVGRYCRRIFFSVTKEFPLNNGPFTIEKKIRVSYNIDSDYDSDAY